MTHHASYHRVHDVYILQMRLLVTIALLPNFKHLVDGLCHCSVHRVSNLEQVTLSKSSPSKSRLFVL